MTFEKTFEETFLKLSTIHNGFLVVKIPVSTDWQYPYIHPECQCPPPSLCWPHGSRLPQVWRGWSLLWSPPRPVIGPQLVTWYPYWPVIGHLFASLVGKMGNAGHTGNICHGWFTNIVGCSHVQTCNDAMIDNNSTQDRNASVSSSSRG